MSKSIISKGYEKCGELWMQYELGIDKVALSSKNYLKTINNIIK